MAADAGTRKFVHQVAWAAQRAADVLRAPSPSASPPDRSGGEVASHATLDERHSTQARNVSASKSQRRATAGAPTRSSITSKAPDAPTAFISWAHRHASWDTEQERDWQAQVANFAISLRTLGIDADLDLFHLDDPAIDWTRFGPKSVRDNEHVLIVVSQAWMERWHGDNPPHEGAGAVAEADELRGLFSADQAEFQRRCFMIQFPDVSPSEIPYGLNRLPRYSIDVEDPDSYDPLLRALTGQPRYPKPPLGEVPVLPAEVLGESLADVDEAIAALKDRLRRPKTRGTNRDTKSMFDSATRGFIEALLQEHGHRPVSELRPPSESD